MEKINHWVFVVNSWGDNQGKQWSARDTYRTLFKDMVWGIGGKTPNKKYLKENDRVVFYQAGPGGQKFVGKGILKSSAKKFLRSSRLSDETINILKSWENYVEFKEVSEFDSPKDLRKTSEKLDFIVRKEVPFVYFQSGIRKISEKDYCSIDNTVSIKLDNEPNKKNRASRPQKSRIAILNKVSTPSPEVNRLQFRVVNASVKAFAESNSIEKLEKAFLSMVLVEYLGIDFYDADDAIVDGSYDGGIDAVYIDDSGNTRPTVHIFQSKYYSPENESRFNRRFEGAALGKMQGSINDYILAEVRDRSFQNMQLQNKLNDVSQLSNPRYQIVFCSNSDHPDFRAKEQFEEFLVRNDTGGEYFEVVYLHLQELSKLLAPEQKKEVDYNLQFSGGFIEYSSGDVKMLLGQVKAEDVGKLREEMGDVVFDRNVRGYLSRKNRINKEIQDAASGEDAPYFVFLNNGITISCRSFTHTPTDASPLLEIENLQIINGGQTTNSIHEIYKKGELETSTKVMVRVLETKKKDLLPKIILSTNNQTKVTSRDLRSNDVVQRLLEKEFRTYGYYYEARKNKYADVTQARGKRIDAEIAAQAYFAAKKKNPAPAKNNKSRLFNDYYEDIFNENTDGKELLACFLIYSEVRKLNKKYKNRYSFANDASFHTTALLFELGIKDVEDIGSKKFVSLYKKILEAEMEVVKERMEEDGDKYSHRSTFINPITIGRLTEVYHDKYK